MEAFMTKKYRKYIGRFEFWHFHPNCPDWPEGNYTHRSELSPRARICPQCVDLRDEDSDPKPGKDMNPRRRLLRL
jgi:hypothetical protein